MIHLLFVMGGQIKAFTVAEAYAELPLDVKQCASLIVLGNADLSKRVLKDKYGLFFPEVTLATMDEVVSYIEQRRRTHEER